MGHLSNEEFLSQLKDLFDRQEGKKRTVFLNFKQFNYSGEEGSSSSNASVVLRATDGNSDKRRRTKLSTVVDSATGSSTSAEERARSFIDEYASFVRSRLAAFLRPKRKRKAVTTAMTATTGDSKASYGKRLPKVIGPRRGAGVEKRRRTIRRRRKAFERMMERERRNRAAQNAQLIA